MSGLNNASGSKNNSLFDYWSFGSYSDAGGLIELRLSLYGAAMPFISVVGMVANLFNLVVLSRLLKRKQSPIYHILLAMAAADFLVTGLYIVNSALFYMRPDPILGTEDLKRLNPVAKFLFLALDPVIGAFAFASNWCTVAVTAFRFVAVFYPLRAVDWCTQRRARIAVASISIAAVVVIGPPYALYLRDRYVAFPGIASDVKKHYWLVYNIAYALVADVVPLLANVVLLSLLIASLRRQRRLIRSSLRQQKRKLENHNNLTVLLISTSAWFVSTTTPSTVTNLLTLIGEMSSTGSPLLRQCFYVGQALVLLNFTGNFFLYACLSKAHRKKLLETTVTCRPTQKRSLSVISSSTGQHHLSTLTIV